MSNSVWLVIALGVMFLAIGGYSALLIARKRALEARLRELAGSSHPRP